MVPNSGTAQLPTISIFSSPALHGIISVFPSCTKSCISSAFTKTKKVPSPNGLITSSSKVIVSTPSRVASMCISRVLSSALGQKVGESTLQVNSYSIGPPPTNSVSEVPVSVTAVIAVAPSGE